MKEEIQILIKYRLERSREALEEARLLLEMSRQHIYMVRMPGVTITRIVILI